MMHPGLAKARPRLSCPSPLEQPRFIVRLPQWRGISDGIHRESNLDRAIQFAKEVGGSVFDTVTQVVIARFCDDRGRQ